MFTISSQGSEHVELKVVIYQGLAVTVVLGNHNPLTQASFMM